MGFYYAHDCCLEIWIDAEPVLILNDGDIDPFMDPGDRPDDPLNVVGYPFPRVYWSNGTITNGYIKGLPEGDA